MSSPHQIIYVNNLPLTLLDVDYGEASFGAAVGLRITFSLVANNQPYRITYEAPTLTPTQQENVHVRASKCDEFRSLLLALETDTSLRESQQYSAQTEAATDTVLRNIAQSIFDDVRSHSPDQDEE